MTDHHIGDLFGFHARQPHGCVGPQVIRNRPLLEIACAVKPLSNRMLRPRPRISQTMYTVSIFSSFGAPMTKDATESPGEFAKRIASIEYSGVDDAPSNAAQVTANRNRFTMASPCC
jgi:hypothetical protein